ncbi:transposase IS200 [Desulforamulus profundi]|uniref:Transposase IS200 n=1 Tax=Desulforamulus profundi TaxID=1383067 RepID=A0A2C6MEW7_9FIRM|nr:transposase [Desulforamulus profundi]PHJ39889.1 transposase IS200 [Desulforamulus profundi]
MPRIPRLKKGEYCTYHVIQRGNERKNIFLDDRDKQRFLDTLASIKDRFNCKFYAYCLMNNHVHLVVDTNGSDISQIMKSLNVSYVMYFNRKYERCGHLFQDRFKSEVIDNDQYLLEVTRYIHLNPVQANMVKDAAHYPWSSYAVYTGGEDQLQNLVDTSLVLKYFSDHYAKACRKYIEYVQRGTEAENDGEQRPAILDFPDAEDEAIREPASNLGPMSLIEAIADEYSLQVSDLTSKRTPHTAARNDAIKQIKRRCNLGLRDIGTLFGGLSESAVSKILKG